ncbi:MAG: cytochrome c oxidase assembly protein [Candidatus Dormibacteria bacterium]
MSFWAPWTHLYGYSLDPGIWIPVALSAALYRHGLRRISWAQRARTSRAGRWRAVSFYTGLAVLLFALQGPVDYLSTYLFWVHMVGHCLVQVVAAPLIVVGAPWMPVWRGLPLRWRRAIAPTALRLLRHRAPHAVGWFFRLPAVGLASLALTFWVWHIPAVYDQALSNPGLHGLEHLTLLVGGLLYWSQTVDSPPLRRRLGTWSLAGYLVAGTATMWVVAVALGFASHPLYAPYYNLANRPGGISALTDQQWGAGIAWVPAAIPFEIMLDVAVLQWLRDDQRRADADVAAWRQNRLPPAP